MEDDIVDDSDLVALERPRHSRLGQGSGAAASTRPNGPDSAGPRKVVQPKPQALNQVKTVSAILVSPRQKGNPVLNNIKSVGWEYSDIPADFVLGTTTCALFLSLKYHRLHPEYVYGRIKALGGRYNLRILLTMVDIENHEAPLKELSKTSLINNVTLVLAWSSQEAGRYLELYKNFENAPATNIKGIQSTTYSDQLVDFVTVPRGINKTDAVSLVAAFGSIRTAMNAAPEEIAMIGGWGTKKIQRWCQTVREPFRLQRAARRGVVREGSNATPALSRDVTREDGSATPGLSREQSHAENGHDAEVARRLGIGEPLPLPSATDEAHDPTTDAEQRPETRIAEDSLFVEPNADEEEAFADIYGARSAPSKLNTTPATASNKRKADGDDVGDDVSDGIAAALGKLRKT